MKLRQIKIGNKKAVIGDFMTMFVAVWIIILILMFFIVSSIVIKRFGNKPAGIGLQLGNAGLEKSIQDVSALAYAKTIVITENKNIEASLANVGVGLNG
jgi:hypothetical protein